MGSRTGTTPPAVLLGRATGPWDAAANDSLSCVEGIVAYDAPSHLLTIAPTLSPKGESCMVPNLAAYDGSAVVVDVDGRSYTATADAHRERGHAVVCLDPFGVLGPESDALNPFDLLAGLESPERETGCHDLAALLVPRNVFADAVEADAFGLLCGVIGYLTAVPDKQTFEELYAALHTDDTVYNLAVVLDTIGKKIPPMAYREISIWLSQDDVTRTRVLQDIRSCLKTLGVPQILRTLSHSTTPLVELRDAPGFAVYLVIPPERLATHGALLRLWVGVLLLHALRTPSAQTLFLIDRCASLGAFPLLESLLGAEPADGCRVWTFWHDVHQLRTTYPVRWPEVVAGSDVVQVLRTRDAAAASEAESLLGLAQNDVWSLAAGQQIVHVDGVAHRMRLLGA